MNRASLWNKEFEHFYKYIHDTSYFQLDKSMISEKNISEIYDNKDDN